MKRLFTVLAVVMALVLMASGAYALGDLENTNNNSANSSSSAVGINNNSNRNFNTNVNNVDVNNRNSNRNNAYSSSSARSNQNQNQGQLQGQMQGQIAAQANGQTMTNNVSENHKFMEADANAWPGINGEKGTNNFNGYSIFGGVGISQTAEYQIAIDKLATIKVMEVNGYLSPEEAKAEAKAAYAQLKYATKDKRMLGILWKSTGRNLLNGFGLLTWDSFWTEGGAPTEKSSAPRVKSADKEVNGNRGYVN